MSKAYESAGVNIEAGYEGVRRIKKHVESTKRPEVLGSLGSFGGLFDLSSFTYKEPVLVSGTDGVGTKLLIAQEMGKHDTIGIDAVAMCVNDIIVQGASPLFFLDYLALGVNDPEVVEQVVSGIAEGCRQSGAALIGGETAEMPGLYKPEEYDVAGFVVGIAEKSQLFDPTNVAAGDVLIGITSSGVHSNGFSLVRKIVAEQGLSWSDPFGDSGKSIGEVFIEPTRIYVKTLKPFLSNGLVKAAAHITGGGLIENVPRMLPEGLGAEINVDAWELPQVFQWLKEKGNLTAIDLYETFNAGIGLVLTVKASDADEVIKTLTENGESPKVIGEVVTGTGVTFKGEGVS
ncbi:phosphoribosylformylglycinamidine cyclo-ligase [Evansella cellulosilytica]|uniref:Phosphoribosylformylglycinamidine cyclo-ligase n=1 Tax=Evansella cellulosilytica (strain ATCC 21833 / DSM 2522 / FERM P-1141 / JCM 9156 / N-4) TaxID=649639 RepID=E6TWM0_EVAC2|nr:phosphoribosylformylglycinamidine cyclo-ligase [Evansella cellulosilytica]ADU28703.1 phosphoribosylformylglycinamidine cyclo-ligase [Evansella cellulosilytica DSM 2522]